MKTRYPVAVWAGPWALAGASFVIADVFSSPRQGPLWVALVGGLIAWAVAGAATVGAVEPTPSPGRIGIGAAIWGTGYVVAFVLARPLMEWTDGFLGCVIAWGVGAAVAGFSARLLREPSGWAHGILPAFAWGIAFLFAGYLAIALGVIAGQLGKGMMQGLFGSAVAFTVGWAVACGLAGSIAGAIGVKVNERD